MNPLGRLWEALKKGWDILRTVYWYNSLPWRILKSGALVVLGFFCLSGGNLLLSYKPDWAVLHYLIAYGFLLILYGPIHHLLVIPVSLKLAHYSWGKRLRLNKRGPFWTLIFFFVAVGLLGLYPPDVMTFDFSALQLSGSHDINPDVSCYRNPENQSPAVIHCRVEATGEIGYVEVENKGKIIQTDRESPYELSIDVSDLDEVVGQKNFHIVLRTDNGQMIRRYVRSASMLERGPSADGSP